LDRVQAAVDASFRIGSDIVIIARTNLLASWDCSKGHCNECYSRVIKLLQNAVEIGADVVSFAGSLGRSDAESITREKFKGTAVISATRSVESMEMKSFGFKMISYPDYFTNALFEGVSFSTRLP
jgi:2-methylisocitrate lyase-like PEP mutase family enzyme